MEMAAEKSVWTGIMRGFSMRCPNCGKGKLFDGYLKIHSPCDVCRNDNARYPSDDLPPYLTIIVAGHVLVGLYMWLGADSDLSMWIQAAIWIPVTLVACLVLLPFTKGAAVGVCWAANIVRQETRT
jgi:uncharacterized protein (DUF983 family)